MIGSYKKLVRDNIPQIIISEGFKPKTRVLKSREYRFELFKKLNEEVKEVVEAKNQDSLIEELADVQEVLTAIYKEYKIECSEVTKKARIKRKKKGGFEKKIYIEFVK